jgi:protein transport protein SEC13
MSTTGVQQIETGHEDMIHDAQLDYYGKKLATCSSDSKIKVYDVMGSEHTLLTELSGHEGPVWEVAWAHPKFGVLLASCSYDRQVIIWRGNEGVWSPIYYHKEHDSSVNSIAWAPHELGLHLACGSSDGRVTILSHSSADDSWKTSGKLEVCHLGVNSVSWAPYLHTGAKVEEGVIRRIATASCDGAVNVYKCAPGGVWEIEHRLSSGSGGAAHGDWVRDVAWAPGSGMPMNTLASAGEDNSVRIWKQGEAGGSWGCVTLSFDAPVWRVSWSITGGVLAVSAGDQSVSLWKEDLGGDWRKLSDVEAAAATGGSEAASA